MCIHMYMLHACAHVYIHGYVSVSLHIYAAYMVNGDYKNNAEQKAFRPALPRLL